MATKNESHNTVAEREVVITRIFNAAREIVFKAWTDPEQLLQWYAPTGCDIRFKSIDVRPGGRFHSCITPPNYHDCWCTGTYKEVVFPERLVFTMEVADENGNRANPVDMGMDPEWPAETTTTVTFEEYENGKTKLTLYQTVSEALAKKTGAHPSWIIMMDRLEERLKTNFKS